MQAARGASLNACEQPNSAHQSLPQPRRIGLFVTVAVLAYAVDLASKIAAVELLSGRSPVEVVGSYFTLSLARNPGAAFSTGTAYTEVLTFASIAAVCTVIWVARRLRSPVWAVGLGFLLGGVLGNLTDRLFRSPGPIRGHVVDFFTFPHFPVFNVADICINLAAATIIIQALRGVRVDGMRHSDADKRAGATES